MTKRKVISQKQLAVKWPTFETLTPILALSYWHAPVWLCAVLYTLLALMWIGVIVQTFNEEIVLLKELQEETDCPTMLSFLKKMEEIRNRKS